jgi:hypothetical protein
MNATHTPGPWKVTDEVYHEDEVAIHGGESGQQVICGVWPQGDDEAGNGERQANARLIAAAPAMHAALRKLIDVLGCDADEIQEVYGGLVALAADDAIAALALAEGEVRS